MQRVSVGEMEKAQRQEECSLTRVHTEAKFRVYLYSCSVFFFFWFYILLFLFKPLYCSGRHIHLAVLIDLLSITFVVSSSLSSI